MRMRNINEEHPLYVAQRARWSELRDLYSGALLLSEPLSVAACDAHAVFQRQFTENCDLKGTSVQEFFSQRMVMALVFGLSYIVLDFARGSGKECCPYLVGYWPDEVINWKRDPEGKRESIVIRTSCLQDSGVRETEWSQYGREDFEIYRQAGEDGAIELVAQGKHGLAALRQVPVFPLRPRAGAVNNAMKRIQDAIAAARCGSA